MNEKERDKSGIKVSSYEVLRVVIHTKNNRGAWMVKVEVEKNNHSRYILEKQTHGKMGEGLE